MNENKEKRIQLLENKYKEINKQLDELKDFIKAKFNNEIIFNII